MPAKPFAAVLMLLLPGTADAADIRQRPFDFSFEVVKAQRDDVFAVCSSCPDDRISSLPAGPHLALRLGQKEVKEQTVKQVAALPEGRNGSATRLLGTVHFPIDSAEISPRERSRLDEFVRGIPAGAVVNLDGYTCDLGNTPHNMGLSFGRARGVAWYLKSKGVQVVKVRGWGKCCPVSDDRRLNRRVEISTPQKEEK